MNIRTRLTLLFIAVVAVIIGISSVAVYFFSENHRYEDYYSRLRSRAVNVAKLLIQVEEVDAALLEKIEQDNPTSLHNERIIILDYQNHIMYSSDRSGEIPLSSDLLNHIRLDGEARFSFGRFEAIGVLYADKFERFVAIAAATDTFGKRKIRVLGNILLIAFVVSILLVSGAGWLYSDKALSPISRVIDQVQNISESSLNIRVDQGNQPDEIGRLAMTFNEMLERLEKSFSAQKNFIANASHELRTPLTAITGKIDVNLQQPRTNEQYRDALMSLQQDVRRLNQLSNRLLLLAQTTAEGAAHFGTIRIDELLWDVSEQLLQTIPSYNVQLNFDLDLDDELLTLKGDEQLLRVALYNLMDNACKYSDDHSVRVSVSCDRGQIVLVFADHGIGIPLDEQQLIFEPFYRGKNAIGYKGHGIGLSLVSKIVKLHQGVLSFRSQPGEGTTFTMALPSVKQF